MQAKAAPIREAPIVIKPETTMADLQLLAKQLEKEFGIKCIQIPTSLLTYRNGILSHFLISLAYHSSSRWKPQKCFPSPPKSQGLITSKDFKGRRCSFP